MTHMAWRAEKPQNKKITIEKILISVDYRTNNDQSGII